MAEIPRASLDYLTEQVNGLSADAQAKVMRVLERVDWEGGDIAECRAAVSEAVRMACGAYADVAAQASADFYDAARELAAGEALGARAVSGYDPAATDGAVRAFTQDIVDGKPVDQFNRKVLERVDYEMKRAAANSTVANARRDPLKPRWARVPSGSETCQFCLMLASRGFVYRSEESAGNHYHAHCDCRIVPGWPGTKVEGYDPDECLERWRAAEEQKAARLGRKFGRVDGLSATEVVEGATYDASDPSEVRRFIERYSGEIRGEPVEHAYILQADGTVRHAVGTGVSVSLEGAEMTGAHIVHNHPVIDGERVSFGGDDFWVMKNHPDIAEIRAVNDTYDYVATIDKGFDGVMYNDAHDGVRIDSSEDYQHQMMEWFREKGYIDYRRTKV